ncbi:hypothetical protein [Streptomyces sp. NPDC096339]|uniref:hypothetical protein n=1 Tax=Streptomyces sp. NPDC096339 TaxID=3366086 RepID=UPI0037F31413
MPVVFVHGVATRESQDYRRAVERRTALWRSFLAPALGVAPSALTVIDPYWGGVASEFRWNHASLPSGTRDDVEKLGGGDVEELVAEITGSEHVFASRGRAPVAALARHHFMDAIDLLWSAAMERCTEAESEELAELAAAAVSYAERHPHPDWLDGVADDREFLARLLAAIRPAQSSETTETFGSGRDGRGRAAVGRLREGTGRIASAASRAATTGLLAMTRSRTHRSVSVFLGDVLCYLRQREQHGAMAPIARTVAEAIEEAERSRTEEDPRLVVVAHSMGGNITYDLLSHLRPDLRVHTLVTVGSQVGVFAELGLLPAVAPPGDPAVDRVPTLPNLTRWLNVFDPDDVLAFRVGEIFDGAEDFRYSTGRGLLHAHSAYFARPSFHRTLARRLAPAEDPAGGGGGGGGGAGSGSRSDGFGNRGPRN